MKLHLGCGKNLKQGYINIDKYIYLPGVENLDIFNLPFENSSVEEILAEHLIEHIKFKDEEKFWDECYRLLKPGGRLITETPDFEWVCKQFLEAEDSFKGFYKVGSKDDYFGNGFTSNQRWGILTTQFFGNQNGEGQFHFNASTKQKLISIAKMKNFSKCTVDIKFNKGAQVLVATMIKNEG